MDLALAKNILQHPFLRVGIVNEDSNRPVWIRLDTVNLHNHVEWTVARDIEDYNTKSKTLLQRQLATKFINLESQPGWRVAVLRRIWDNSLDIMLVWHHGYFDGTGGKVFHESLLQALNSISTKELDTQQLDGFHQRVLRTTVQNLPPPQEKLADYPITAGFLVSAAWDDLKKSMAWTKLATRTSWGYINNPQASPTTCFSNVAINKGTLDAVISACRSKHTTLTGLLHAITLVSLVPQVGIQPMVGGTALNLRRHYAPDMLSSLGFDRDKIIANFVSAMDHKFEFSLEEEILNLHIAAVAEVDRFAALQEPLWAVARKVRGDIEDRLTLGLKNDVVGLMKYVNDFRAHAKGELKKKRVLSWAVTNIGVVEGRLHEEEAINTWTIQGGVFSLSVDITGPVFHISAMSLKGGKLTIQVSWQEGIVDDSVGEQLAADIEAWIKHVGSSN